jgi:hypothetical protein
VEARSRTKVAPCKSKLISARSCPPLRETTRAARLTWRPAAALLLMTPTLAVVVVVLWSLQHLRPSGVMALTCTCASYVVVVVCGEDCDI